MKPPARIKPLIDDGIIDEVIQSVMSGKEASVYIVRCGENIRCAKVYKDAQKRSFKQASLYQEGRKVRNSRKARAMEKRSKFGRKQQEEAWQSTEMDALGKLDAAGVRVPKTYGLIDGVLLMDLITDEEGLVAPRLSDVHLSVEQALEDHAVIMQYIVRMLCCGIIHGDLSEFNILLDAYGPVIIDLPQAVDAAANNHAQSMLERDVNRIRDFYAQYAPELRHSQYAKEIWDLYQKGSLYPDSGLTGCFDENLQEADVDSVLQGISAALAEENARLERLKKDED